MYDLTVSRPSGARDSSAITQREPSTKAADRADNLLAAILITNWMLATGRTLPADVAPQSLSEEELISFWADDQIAGVSSFVPSADQR